MKTAEEYFEKYKEDWGEHIPYSISEKGFELALAERDQEWRDKIEKLIENKYQHKLLNSAERLQIYEMALKELLEVK